MLRLLPPYSPDLNPIEQSGPLALFAASWPWRGTALVGSSPSKFEFSPAAVVPTLAHDDIVMMDTEECNNYFTNGSLAVRSTAFGRSDRAVGRA
jgi:hypothetical protein